MKIVIKIDCIEAVSLFHQLSYLVIAMIACDDAIDFGEIIVPDSKSTWNTALRNALDKRRETLLNILSGNSIHEIGKGF